MDPRPQFIQVDGFRLCAWNGSVITSRAAMAIVSNQWWNIPVRTSQWFEIRADAHNIEQAGLVVGNIQEIYQAGPASLTRRVGDDEFWKNLKETYSGSDALLWFDPERMETYGHTIVNGIFD